MRLLPGEDPKAFMDEIRRVIADDSIKIEIVLSFRRRLRRHIRRR